MLKQYLHKQPLSLLLVVAIWIMCLIPVPETPLDDVHFIDKWVHLAMYGSLTFLIMAEYGWHHSSIQWCRFSVGAIFMPVIMGGLVELAQAYLTMGIRSGDWLDFAANSCGVVIGALFGSPVAILLSHRG